MTAPAQFLASAIAACSVMPMIVCVSTQSHAAGSAYQVEVFAPFRGERGDLLSQPSRELVVNGFVRYDVVLEDANP